MRRTVMRIGSSLQVMTLACSGTVGCKPQAKRESQAQAVFEGDRREVKNLDKHPYRSICRLLSRFKVNGENKLIPCSGSVVGPRTLLTAGHCVSSPRGALYELWYACGAAATAGSPKSSRVSPDRPCDKKSEWCRVYRPATKISLFPHRNGSWLDVAVLQTPLPNEEYLGRWAIGNDDLKEATLSGFPADGDRGAGSGAKLLEDSGALTPGEDSWTPSSWFGHGIEIDEDEKHGTWFHEIDSSTGQSGSPLWVRSDESVYVVGVHYGSVATDKINTAARLSDAAIGNEAKGLWGWLQAQRKKHAGDLHLTQSELDGEIRGGSEANKPAEESRENGSTGPRLPGRTKAR